MYLGGEDPTIPMGSKRVGIPGHAAGVTVYHWCKPACFAKHCLRVDYAPTGRAKCKADGLPIPKGSLRLLIGYKKESTVYKVDNVANTIVPELVRLVGRSNVTIHGVSELALDERLRVESFILDGLPFQPPLGLIQDGRAAAGAAVASAVAATKSTTKSKPKAIATAATATARAATKSKAPPKPEPEASKAADGGKAKGAKRGKKRGREEVEETEDAELVD